MKFYIKFQCFLYIFPYTAGYDSIDSMKKAVQSLRYMLLCKVMLGAPEEVQGLLSGKLALKYRGKNVSMKNACSYFLHPTVGSDCQILIISKNLD